MRQYLIDRTLRQMAAYAHERMQPVYELNSDRCEIPANHKCWRCEWATWCGDRFFCPLAFVCVKDKRKTKEVVIDGTEAIDSK